MIRFKALAICALAAAGPFGTTRAQDATPVVQLLGAREPLLAAFDAMPEARLKATFLRCDRESRQRVLSLDEAAPCSIAWDTLLKREYGGNLESLLAWWRAHRDDVDAR
jgi:hypothetical protein